MNIPSASYRLAAVSAMTLLISTPAAITASAAADPITDPCQLAFSLFCRMVPIAPELEHSIDLTQNQPPGDPAAPLPEDFVPPDPCAGGCI